jgi:hypothetical protein
MNGKSIEAERCGNTEQSDPGHRKGIGAIAGRSQEPREQQAGQEFDADLSDPQDQHPHCADADGPLH